MTEYLSPSPWLSFTDNSGDPLSGGLLFTYLNNTVTKANTFTDASGATPNTNPIVLDSYGQCDCWLPPGQLFTFTLAPSTDTDPPTNIIKSRNNISAGGAVATINFGIDTGIVNASVASIPGIAGLMAGLTLTLRVAITNTGPTTLNASGTGPKPIILQNGGFLAGGELQAGGQYLLQYTGTAWQILGFSVTSDKERSAGEIAANVTPVNYAYFALDPRRYGCVMDGVTDDTSAAVTWRNVVNATVNPVSIWPAGLTMLCGPLGTITANNFTWHMNSTILVKLNSWGVFPAPLTTHISITGTGARIYSLTVNGNQAAFTTSPFGQILSLSGNDALMEGCSLTNAGGRALFLGLSGGRFSNCHFDNNTGAGLEIEQSSRLKFVNCTMNLNGYPWGSTVIPGVPLLNGGFSTAIRFRSHDITFVDCEALQACSDGINVNQGSYAIKFIGCLAWMCGDAGFTIAADNTSTGAPGEGESCYDLEYVDCEAYNNWGGGLVAYAPCYNVTVEGGRYYNNHRLAGVLAEASSYFSGIYIAGGSLAIRVWAKSYDDRQACPITSVSGSGPYVVTATGWVPGTAANYPRIMLLNASGTFAGYGNITAESAGSVTVTPSTFSNFSGPPVAGQTITQRVQHNGCFFDNGCTGTMDIDGFGFLPGALAGLSGYKMLSGPTAGGQNVLLPGVTVDYTELLANPTFDAGTGSGSSWTYNLPGGGAANAYSTAGANIRSPGALQLIGGTSPAVGDATLIASGLAYAQGTFVEASAWVSATAPGDATLTLLWNPGGTGVLATVVNHPGGGYKQLKIGAFIPTGNTQLDFRVTSIAGKTNYDDNLSLRVKSEYSTNLDFSYPTRNLPL